ncbi:phage major capsid protein [Nocardioides sp. LHD-245]|uniref:head maturation protease, ClpP-related n=1 Tax=Nocardioides sp. LHD-245 TaxID=3051387 RepID=UPI0027DF8827|nr:phage major capsid protein [Nocardioides sp. LHD-245]
MPEMYRFRDRLPNPGEGKQPRAELAVTVEDTTAQMYLYDVIDDWGGYWGISASEVAEALTTLPPTIDTIHLRINSPGGMVFEAIAIKNLFAGHSAKVVAIVDGLAASAASFIATAADETVMGENTELMIHDAHVIAQVDADGARALATDLDRVSDNIASIYAKKAGTELAEWREVMKSEKWYGAQEAVDAGLADRVGTADSPTDSTPARQLHAVALDVVRGKTAAQWTPEGITAPAAASTTSTTSTATTKEQEGHQAETAPSGTAETGAPRSEVTQPPAPSPKETAMPSMSIEEREARITEIDARLAEIDAGSTGDVLNTEDQTEWDTLLAEKSEHGKAVKAARARKQVLEAAALNPAANESEELLNERRRGLAPAVHIKPENIYDFGAIRNQTSTVEQRNKKLNEHALRAVEIAKFSGVGGLGSTRADAQAHVTALLERESSDENVAEPVLATRILRSGSELYNRAFGKAFAAAARFNPNPMAGLSTQEVQALTLGSDPDGGYAVPFQLDPTVILTSAGSTNPMRQLARVVEITGKKWEGLTSAGSVATREGETDEAALSNPEFAQPVVDTSRVDVFVDFSIALESAWSELSSELSVIIADALDEEEATSFITGDGTALTSGGTKPQGILTGLSATTTTYVVTAGTGALVRTDLYNVLDALPNRFDTDDVAWIGSRSFFTNTRGLETVGDTTPLADDQARTLLGVAKHRASGMPNFATTSNANLAIYGNIRRAYVIADRIGFNLALIPILTGTNGRPNGKRGVWGYRYNGAKLINPNAARLLRMK